MNCCPKNRNPPPVENIACKSQVYISRDAIEGVPSPSSGSLSSLLSEGFKMTIASLTSHKRGYLSSQLQVVTHLAL